MEEAATVVTNTVNHSLYSGRNLALPYPKVSLHFLPHTLRPCKMEKKIEK
jgi:hypothetical protein